ncbi:HAD hydrolase family protein [Enterococcus termitis]
MTVKMIAVDMDGTFLNSEKDYDREKFNHLYKKMCEQNVRFVVASGNQYYQLKSFSQPLLMSYLLCQKMVRMLLVKETKFLW